MTIAQLEEALLARAPESPKAREKWVAAVRRLMAAAAAPESFGELADRLPPKARYVGPGPWLDAVRDSHKQR